MVNFYRCTIESTLTNCMSCGTVSVWYLLCEAFPGVMWEVWRGSRATVKVWLDSEPHSQGVITLKQAGN